MVPGRLRWRGWRLRSAPGRATGRRNPGSGQAFGSLGRQGIQVAGRQPAAAGAAAPEERPAACTGGRQIVGVGAWETTGYSGEGEAAARANFPGGFPRRGMGVRPMFWVAGASRPCVGRPSALPAAAVITFSHGLWRSWLRMSFFPSWPKLARRELHVPIGFCASLRRKLLWPVVLFSQPAFVFNALDFW
jgi:hypothetical protein